MPLADTFKVQVKCPKCGEQIPKSLRELKLENIVTCGCGTAIEVKADNLEESVSELDHFDEAWQSLKDLSNK